VDCGRNEHRPQVVVAGTDRRSETLALSAHRLSTSLALSPAVIDDSRIPCYGAVNVIPLLQGPLPDALDVTTHHCPAPGFSTTPGAIEHVPVPLAQPTCAAV